MLRPSKSPLIEVGFWKPVPGDLAGLAEMLVGPRRPDPRRLVDATWSPRERDAVIRYLEAGRRGESWMGYSLCRFCGIENGSCDRTDGVYVWPDGFAHYLREHNVKPPFEFLVHALRKERARL